MGDDLARHECQTSEGVDYTMYILYVLFLILYLVAKEAMKSSILLYLLEMTTLFGYLELELQWNIFAYFVTLACPWAVRLSSGGIS